MPNPRRTSRAPRRATGSPGATARLRGALPAFTLVELIVVITVITIVLAIAVPGLTTMAAESRFSTGVAVTGAALTHAYSTALADLNVTAVRFVPDYWDNDPTAAAGGPTGRQHIVTYSYTQTSSADTSDLTKVSFGEYFQRQAGTPSVVLPDDVWVAPIETLETGQRMIKTCTSSDPTLIPKTPTSSFGAELLKVAVPPPGPFVVDAAVDSAQSFYQADDFLIIFDPRQGLRSGGVVEPHRLKGYIPADSGRAAADADGAKSGSTTIPFRRYSFSGVTLYNRGAFLESTAGQDAGERQNWLRRNSRPYLIHRFGGGLVTGTRSLPVSE